MASQLSLRLPTALAEKLAQAAARMQRKQSEVVRLALEQFLETELEARPITRVRDLLGSVESGLPDLGSQHRTYLKSRPISPSESGA
ncbi:MAG: ribbon-helix-helix protein, CopG family [Desulfurellaceae bacterium]|nr:ribbon-helix-helix protein, CopG family [Desulfurellaceae bacterium]